MEITILYVKQARGFIKKMMKEEEVLIVGAGLSGCVMAERIATVLGRRVLIIDKRDHIGGNCYDFIDENGILVNRYGAHLFHTDDRGVWEYINQFATWERWEHKVVGCVDGRLVPIPANITTVNMLCGQHIRDEKEMAEWMEHNTELKREKDARNGRDIAVSRVGEELYKKIFREYTFKQWGKYPEDLRPEVLARIPLRTTFDERYFTDRYQALPIGGYTRFFEKLINSDKIRVELCVDFFKMKDKNDFKGKSIIFTGPIDAYFSSPGRDRLEYRSIRFETEHHKDTKYYQPNSVVNYPQTDVPFTRIVEYKHFLHQTSPHTTIVKEFPTDEGEPYYPVLNNRNLALYEMYKRLATEETTGKGVHFLGRLANYKYFNMDQAIRNALDYFDEHFIADKSIG